MLTAILARLALPPVLVLFAFRFLEALGAVTDSLSSGHPDFAWRYDAPLFLQNVVIAAACLGLGVISLPRPDLGGKSAIVDIVSGSSPSSLGCRTSCA